MLPYSGPTRRACDECRYSPPTVCAEDNCGQPPRPRVARKGKAPTRCVEHTKLPSTLPENPLAIPRICEVCEGAYLPRNRGQATCSTRCSLARRGAKSAPYAERGCALPGCENRFVPAYLKQQGCCRQHMRRIWYRNSPEHRAKVNEKARARRALKAGARVGPPVSTSEVADRDGWRCHLCRKAVRRNCVWPHPLSASLDHVVPLSKGGEHAAVNLRLAHLRCNIVKGNKGGGEQLLLIG